MNNENPYIHSKYVNSKNREGENIAMETRIIEIDAKLFKTISKIAKNKGVSENKIVNDIVKNNIKNNENVFDEIEKLSDGKAIIGNKNTYNPKKENWEKLINMKKSSNGVKPVKALLDLRVGKG